MSIFSWQPWPQNTRTPPALLHTHTHHHQRMPAISFAWCARARVNVTVIICFALTQFKTSSSHMHTHTQRETIEKTASRTTTAPPAFTCSQRTEDTGVRRRRQRPCRRRHRRCRLYMMSLVFAMGGHADGGVWERYIFFCVGALMVSSPLRVVGARRWRRRRPNRGQCHCMYVGVYVRQFCYTLRMFAISRPHKRSLTVRVRPHLRFCKMAASFVCTNELALIGGSVCV